MTDDERREDVTRAMDAVRSGQAGHWPTVAQVLADEVERMNGEIGRLQIEPDPGTDQPTISDLLKARLEQVLEQRDQYQEENRRLRDEAERMREGLDNAMRQLRVEKEAYEQAAATIQQLSRSLVRAQDALRDSVARPAPTECHAEEYNESATCEVWAGGRHRCGGHRDSADWPADVHICRCGYSWTSDR